jgi:uncharacterized membrane protein
MSSPQSLSAKDAPAAYKSIYERFFHAILFELLALLLCAPLMSLILQVSFAHAGALTLMISLLAMTWNVVFNSLFDRLERRCGWQRNWGVRLLHASVFEIGLLLMVVPMAAWWLDIGLLQAFVLDIGLILFFLPYTLVYNWCYDKLRASMTGRVIC